MLPAIDDGARDLREALAMARMAALDGIRAVVLTPHQLGQNGHLSGDAIRSATQAFAAALARERIPLTVFPGADVRIEPELARRIQSGEVLTIADDRRHILLELPHEVYMPLDGVLAELEAIGVTGVLTHPERNHGLLADARLVQKLLDRGCLLQITAGSLLGEFGSRSKSFAEMMVRRRWVHFVSSDGHSIHRRKPQLRAAFDYATQLIDRETALSIFCHNPAAVVAGGTIHAAPRAQSPRKSFWSSLFGQRKAG